MGSFTPPYPPAFRAEAVRLVQESGKTRRQIAHDFGVSTETLRQWVKQAELDAGLRQDGLTTEEIDEVRQLRREVQRLREEREILKKQPQFLHVRSGQASPRRPSRPGGEVCVRGAREGASLCGQAVPGAGGLHQWLLRLADAGAIGSERGRCRADGTHRADSSRKSRPLWRTPYPCGVGRCRGPPGARRRW
jgi:transposase